MLTKKNRLAQRVRLQHPASFKTSLFTIKIAPNNLPDSRFGVIIAKRIDKRAVARNRMRRLIQTSIAHLLPDMKSGYDMLVIVHKNFAESTENVVQEELRKALQKHHFIQ